MNKNIKAGADIHAGDGGYSEGTKENYEAFVKVRNYEIPEVENPKYKMSYSDCDCGCNIPVAATPEKMLRFLAYRLEMAGVDEAVSVIYARDIRKILDEFYGGAD